MLKAPSKNEIQLFEATQEAAIHYCRAVDERPDLADILTDKSAEESADALTYQWEYLGKRIEKKNVRPLDWLAYHVAEAEDAMVNGKWDVAREKIFDSIAVLLRLDDAVRVAKEQIG